MFFPCLRVWSTGNLGFSSKTQGCSNLWFSLGTQLTPRVLWFSLDTLWVKFAAFNDWYCTLILMGVFFFSLGFSVRSRILKLSQKRSSARKAVQWTQSKSAASGRRFYTSFVIFPVKAGWKGTLSSCWLSCKRLIYLRWHHVLRSLFSYLQPVKSWIRFMACRSTHEATLTFCVKHFLLGIVHANLESRSLWLMCSFERCGVNRGTHSQK